MVEKVISMGILEIGAICAIGAIGAFVYYKNKRDIIDIKNLSSDEEKYEINKWIVQDAISKNDIDKLKRLKDNNNITKHKDLLELIEQHLKAND